MSSAEIKANRPLSPHIQIYRWHLTMVMSIVHRVTGGALYFGTLLLAAWLVALASGPGPFATAQAIAGSWFGLVVLFGYSWALIHHLLGGLRYFVWDFGYALGKPARDRIALANLVLSIVLTLLVWAVALMLR
jgi:succinate dehydrogenase / fumarate reductase, cytochrome b subunit